MNERVEQMALSIMKIFTILIVMGIVFGGFATILNEYGTPSTTAGQYSANAICLGGCYSNVSKNISSVFYNSSLNPFQTTASKSLNLSNNLTQASQAVGFSFAFILNDFGNVGTSLVQAPRTFTSIITIMLGNLNLLIGGSTSLTGQIVGGIVALIALYLFLMFLSAWMKYPLAG